MALYPSLGTIHVIFSTLDKEARPLSRVMAISPYSEFGEEDKGSKRIRSELEPILGLSNTNKVDLLAHDDALVVTLQIGGFNVRKVMVDQGSKAEIMYLDLYKGLKLKPKDLGKFDPP